MDDPLIGRQLANYKIERLIGRGGMAQVYFGQDVSLQRPVAIKVIDVRYRDNPAYADRFLRESRGIATWRHEHVIQIYYAGEESGLFYFVMEHIDGEDLGQTIARYANAKKRMPSDEVLRIGHAIASALDYAHQKGVIHRDIKPANVLLAQDGRIVLMDFGLALDVEQGSLGEVFGSSQYISPEQARRSSDAVPQSDLYSLGVILYQMLVGLLPFDDPSPTTVALQHVTLAPPAPREVNPELNKATESVLMKALSKAPKDRYKTGDALMAALDKALGADRVTAPTDVLPLSKKQAQLKSTENLIGQQLDEYRLDTLLGRGGMARIYRGLDVRLNRYAAIKVIDTPLRTQSDYAARFKREAQAIAQLEHPNIVRLYRYGEVHGLLYMAMQYLEGKDLGAVLAALRKKRAWLEPEQISRIVREVCAALDYAHSRGVIHRDVKPSNIMIDDNGHAIVTDFGLALLTETGSHGEIFGSPYYIAPEQAISSANATPQSDLYALGVILFEMFTGRVPFDAGSPLDIAMLHMTEAPPSPRQVRASISPQVEAVILKALAKEQKDRYQSGAELIAALDQSLQATPVPIETKPTRSKSAAKPIAALLPPIPAAVASPAPVVRKRAKVVAPVKPAPRRRRKILAAFIILLLLALFSAAAIFVIKNTAMPGVGSISPTRTLTSVQPTSQSLVATPAAALRATVKATAKPTVAPKATLKPTAAPTIAPQPTPIVLLPGIFQPHQYKILLPLIIRNAR